MDAAQLAQKMLDWGKLHEELATLTAEIETAVLVVGKTQNVGNVRATYSKGRKRYDYEKVGRLQSPEIIAAWTITKTVETTSWRDLCSGEGIKDIPFTQGEPGVKVKMVS